MRWVRLATIGAAVVLALIADDCFAQPISQRDLGKVLRDASQTPPERAVQVAPEGQRWVLAIGLLPVVALFLIMLLLRWFSAREQREALHREGGPEGIRPHDTDTGGSA